VTGTDPESRAAFSIAANLEADRDPGSCRYRGDGPQRQDQEVWMPISWSPWPVQAEYKKQRARAKPD
jgi:hypothetical protein